MDSREHSEMPPAPSYPSPNAAQIAQGTVSYYANQRHLTADELHLSAELSREVSAANVNDGGANGLAHGQGMVLGASNPSGVDVNRAESAEHHAQHQESQQNQQAQQQQSQPQPQQQPQSQPQQQPQQQSQQSQQQQQPQHMLQFPPNQQVGMDPNHDLSYGDQSARRKRSKVSRACDECRRKKVRCDATSEAGVETCSNCRRTGATCEFSRVPMKRGPSKGYIKELADRINSLESQMQPPAPQSQAEMHYQTIDAEASSNREYQDFSPSIDNQAVSRKRTLSMSEGLQNTFMQPPFSQDTRPTSVGGWPVQTPAKDASHANDLAALDSFAGSSAANGATKVVQPFWSQDAAEISQQARTNVELRDDLPAPVQIDEQVFEAYYRHIHPIFPILPTSQARALCILQLAERQVQEMFLHALYAVTGASLSRAQNELQVIPTFEKAQDCLYESFRESSQNRSLSANFVLLHTLILMILDADSRGPENLHGQNGISKSILVEATFTLVYQIANLLGQTKTSNTEDKNPDSDGNLARKNWAVAMILSRWHTVSVASPDFFGFHDVGTPEDRQLFGFGTAQLSRYTNTLAGINVALFENSVHPSFGRSANHALERSLHSQLNLIRDLELYHPTSSQDELNTAYTESVCPLTFWYLTLLSKRHLYTQIPAEILHPAEGIINILHQQSESTTPITSPFHYHFLALAVITLLEITDIPELASDAWKSLDKALQVIHKRERHAALAGEFQSIFTNQSWEACIRATIESKLAKFRPDQADSARQNAAAPLVGPTEQRSLEHLADLAVGAGGGSGNAQSPPPQSTGDDKDVMAGASSNAPPLPEMAPPSSSGQKQDVRVCVDFTQLTKKGYLNVFAGL